MTQPLSPEEVNALLGADDETWLDRYDPFPMLRAYEDAELRALRVAELRALYAEQRRPSEAWWARLRARGEALLARLRRPQ